MNKRKSHGRGILLTLLLVAVLVTSAFAASTPAELAEQLASNTAAWIMARDSGDSAAASSIFEQSEALAEQLAGAGGSIKLNQDGTWNIRTADGYGISTSMTTNGKNTVVTAAVGNTNGLIAASSSNTYMDDSIAAFMAGGGTHELLQQGYNNAGAAITAANAYGNSSAKTSSAQEIAIAKEIMGLTDAQATALGNELNTLKQQYESAHDNYKAAVASGDTAAANAARALMDQAHADAEAARAQYNYTADSVDTSAMDGGYFYGSPTGTPTGIPTGIPSGAYFNFPTVQVRTITVTCSEGGTVSPAPTNGVIAVGYNGSVTVTMQPSAGYKVKSVTVDGAAKGALSTYSFGSVTSNHTLSVEFERSTYTISASAGTGGTISPSGSVSVSDGGSMTFAVTPDTGYKIKAVKVDGSSQGEVSGFTFTGVTGNHSISAEFEKQRFTISASAGAGGSISPNGSKSVRYGDSQTFSVSPSTGYKIKSVKVDGVDQGAVSSFTFRNVTAPHSITAEFEKRSYAISASAGTGGSISPSGSVSVFYGNTRTFSITANTGYRIKNVVVDGISRGAVSSYTFTNVTAPHWISADFERLRYSITASADTGGSISPAGQTSVEYGNSQTYSFTPAWGYEVSDVRVDGVSVGAVSSYTFRNVTSAHSISVYFRANGRVSVDSIGLTDAAGTSLAGNSIKSGYGIFARVSVDVYNVTDVALTFQYNFGEGQRIVTLAAQPDGSYAFPVNSASPTGACCVYIPVGASDGSYTVTLTLTGINAAGETVTDSDTAVIRVLGSMYEDDFTGDR